MAWGSWRGSRQKTLFWIPRAQMWVMWWWEHSSVLKRNMHHILCSHFAWAGFTWGTRWVQSPQSYWSLVTALRAHAVRQQTHVHVCVFKFVLSEHCLCVNKILRKAAVQTSWTAPVSDCAWLRVRLTTFALFGRHLYVGQPHILGLVLDYQQANKWGNDANHSRGGQYRPPAVTLRQHSGNDGAQAAGQIHAARQNRPPRPELRGLEPLMEEKREKH